MVTNIVRIPLVYGFVLLAHHAFIGMISEDRYKVSPVWFRSLSQTQAPQKFIGFAFVGILTSNLGLLTPPKIRWFVQIHCLALLKSAPLSGRTSSDCGNAPLTLVVSEYLSAWTCLYSNRWLGFAMEVSFRFNTARLRLKKWPCLFLHVFSLAFDSS